MAELTTATGWVTFYTVRLPGGRTGLVQKNDGATRTITITTSQRAHAR